MEASRRRERLVMETGPRGLSTAPVSTDTRQPRAHAGGTAQGTASEGARLRVPRKGHTLPKRVGRWAFLLETVQE